MKRILITGGAGFVGSHVVKFFLENTGWDLVIMDRLDFSGTLHRLEEVVTPEDKKRVTFVHHDLKSPINDFVSKEIGEVDHVIHLAASSHVDRSLSDPMSFIMDNVVGTTNLLLWAKDGGMRRLYKSIEGMQTKTGDFEYAGKFLNFSTDESVGPAPEGVNHTEDAPHRPSNPYSASKAGQEDIGYAFHVSYGLPVITTRTMNNYGTMQTPEKLIPKTIRSVVEGKPMPIFAQLNDEGKLEAVGSRFWLNTKNTASAVLFLLLHGKAGEIYNIIGFDELTNLEIAEKVAFFVGKPLIPEFVDFHKTRKGNDRR